MHLAAWIEDGSWRIFADEQRKLVRDTAYYQASLVEDLVESPVFLHSWETWYTNGKLLWFQILSVNNSRYMQLYTKTLPKELEALLIVYGLQ